MKLLAFGGLLIFSYYRIFFLPKGSKHFLIESPVLAGFVKEVKSTRSAHQLTSQQGLLQYDDRPLRNVDLVLKFQPIESFVINLGFQ